MEKQWDKVFKKYGKINMVRCLIKKGNKFLLVLEKNENTWETPGGRLFAGEDIEKALLREVLEETGYKIRLIKPLIVAVSESWEARDKKIICVIFKSEIIEKVREPELDIIDIKWFSREEIKKLKPDWHDKEIFQMIVNKKL